MSRPWPACTLVFLAALPLSAALQVSPERILTPPLLDRAQGAPLIASNDTGYLTAWTGHYYTLFVEPLGRDGNALSDKPVPVMPPDFAPGMIADLASDGTNYLIVTYTASELATVVVDSSGQLVASTRVASSGSYTNQARLAWNGERYLLVYTPVSPSGLVLGQLLDRRGAPIGTSFTILDNLRSPSVAVAANGRDFLVADFSNEICGINCVGLFTVAVSASGAVSTLNNLGPTDVTSFVNHQLRFTGRRYVLAWSSYAGNFRSVNEVPLDAIGQPLRPAKVIATGDISTSTRLLNLVSTGGGAVALIQHDNKIRGVRIDANGEPVDAQPIDLFDVLRPPGVVLAADAAAIGGDVFAVWTHYETAPGLNPVSFLYGSNVDFTKLQTGRSIVSAAIDDILLDLAGSGRTQLMLTMHLKPAQRGDTVYARRFVDGVMAGEPIAVIEPQPQTPLTSIASHGDDFLIVSAEFAEELPPRRIRARLLHGGTLTKRLELGTGSDAPFAIWTGDHYLALWTVTDFAQQSGYRQRLMATRIGAGGELLDSAPREIAAAPDFNTGYAKILATRAGLVAIFLHGAPAFFRTVEILSYDIYAARISADGDFIGAPVQITNSMESEISLNAATDPTGNIFLTWVEIPLDYHYGQNARGAVIGNDLSVKQLFDFSSPTAHAVAWTGSSFAVAWYRGQVYVQPYSRDGDPASEAIALTEDASAKTSPLIVSMPGGAFIAYTRPLPESSGSDAQRLVGRTIFDQARRRAVTSR